MKWIIFTTLFLVALVLFVLLLIDGRYFGKRLMYWVYDVIGPAVFSARSEEARWRSLIETIGLQGDERVLDVGRQRAICP